MGDVSRVRKQILFLLDEHISFRSSLQTYPEVTLRPESQSFYILCVTSMFLNKLVNQPTFYSGKHCSSKVGGVHLYFDNITSASTTDTAHFTSDL